MAYRNYHKRKIADRELHPETQMMSYGYDPFLSDQRAQELGNKLDAGQWDQLGLGFEIDDSSGGSGS